MHATGNAWACVLHQTYPRTSPAGWKLCTVFISSQTKEMPQTQSKLHWHRPCCLLGVALLLQLLPIM